MQNRLSQGKKSRNVLIRLFLLGPMRIEVEECEVDLSSRKARALLAYLALRRGIAVPRETIVGLLWGDRSEDQARASLRQTLSAIRRMLSENASVVLTSTNESVMLVADTLWIDTQALDAVSTAASPKDLTAVAELYRGDLLEGMSLNEPAFDQWLSGERENARSKYCQLLEYLVDGSEQERRTEDAAAWCAKLLAMDPLQETSHRRLMRLYFVQGRYDAALNQFEQCKRELARQLDVAPSRQTLDLEAEIKTQRKVAKDSEEPIKVAPADVAAIRTLEDQPRLPTLPEKPSIAVLPFSNLSADPEQEFFSDGITEDIITELSRYRDLFVIARNSSFIFKGTAADAREIGQKLGVRYLLEGSVRRAANRIRVSAQLIDAITADHVWADRYDREIIDIFEIQDDLTRSIAATLKGRVDGDMVRHSALKPTASLSAYEFVLRAQQHVQKYTEMDFSEARQLLEKAISVDPNFARAHGWLAYVVAQNMLYWKMSADSVKQAIEIGEYGLTLDDSTMRCHLALGVSYLFSGEHNRAGHHFEKALLLNPNDEILMIEYGRFLMYTNAPKDGADYVRQAMRQNPYHPNWYWNILGRCLHTAKDYAGAIAAFERIENTPFWSYAFLAACHAELGHTQDAKKNTEAVLRLHPDFSISKLRKIAPYRDPDVLEDFLGGFSKAGFAN